jgi:hypothetical protein
MGIFQSIFGNRNRKPLKIIFTVTITKEYIKVEHPERKQKKFYGMIFEIKHNTDAGPAALMFG